ncbi:filamentous hemagglutinin N-terminal domain-containing protein [Polynucleobacter sp. 30F-ANTBAC]|uniref:beta strand repeat-containing protein n=1 Tax=Polynucleobacter sp. 30F-ANTBAC TaxID=2689095 RepID=UPI001C0DD20B|nr:filamentous hemagglutinin N-terminal domain-containing protein [Polynucleobacter sp. 30F-ANTBAC]MBU3599119.1 filamentous hemagglutinin N-terminal domain-containing protein [Polynucleobacter sp. 30F-ANTBAC]
MSHFISSSSLSKNCKPQFRAAKLLAALAIAGLAHQSMAAAPGSHVLPTGGKVVAGAATIATSGNAMNINQSSQRAVVNWSSFDVGSQATVNFNQPNSSAATLNYVNSASKSMINGAVNANGQVIFINNNGIVFGSGAQINVGGMIATTMNTCATEFMSGRDNLVFEGGNDGKIINKGNITGNNINSYIALMAPQVKNSGVITATMSGNNAIALVSGQKVSLKFSGSQLVNVSVDASVINSLISNKLLINAGSGQVIIAANAAQDLMGSIVRNTGVVSASDISTAGGKVTLIADTIDQKGVIEANSVQNTGGKVSLKGNNIALRSGSKTTATGATGGGDIEVGVNSFNQESLENSIKNNNLASFVTVESNAIIDTSAIQSGNGGRINIWSLAKTSVAGNLYARGGAQGGNGGFIETSSIGNVDINQGLKVDTSSPNGRSGRWVIDPTTLIIDSTAAAAISNALNTTSVTLDATGSSCSAFGASCTQSQTALIRIMAGADIYSSNSATSLSLVATGGQIDIDSHITAGAVYAVAQNINVNGSINTNGGSSSNIYLAGAIINILGNINSNGNSSNNSNNSSNTNSGTLNTVNTTTANNRRNGNSNNQNNLNTDGNTYTTNGGLINIIATGDINIGSTNIDSSTNPNAYISANGVNGGTITIVSTAGKVNINAVIDTLGKSANAGKIDIAGKAETNLTNALISTEGLSQGGLLNLGQINNLGNGTILAPPATAPPAPQALLTFVQDSVSATTLNSNNSITSNSVIIDSQTGINAPNGNIVVFGDQIQVNNSSITAANGTIAIGREGYSSGALSSYASVTNTSLAANKVETSGKTLEVDSNTILASEWLLDPTNVTIGGTSGTSTGSAPLITYTNQANVNAADIVAAINAGTSVTIIADGSITLSSALTFANASGAAATLILDNTSGSKQSITFSAGITATGANPVNVIAKSAGGQIIVGSLNSVNGTINVNGVVTLDDTYNVGGTTSGFITAYNASTYANNGSGTQSAIKINSPITATEINIKGAVYSGPSVQAIWVAAALTASGDINVHGANQSNGAAPNGSQSGIYTIANTAKFISTGGTVYLSGVGHSAATGGQTIGVFLATPTTATTVTVQANRIILDGYSDQVNYTGTTVKQYARGVSLDSATLTINSTANYDAGGVAILINGTTSEAVKTTNGVYINGGFIKNNANGGDILITSNRSILSNAPFNIAANTTANASRVLFDSTRSTVITTLISNNPSYVEFDPTTSGTSLSTITNSGAITVAAGSSKAVNLIQKSNGATISDGAGAINVSGYIDINNNAVSGPSATATTLNSLGATITGPMTAGVLAGNIGVRINAISTGTGLGINGTSTITSLAGPVTLTGQSQTANAIKLTGAVSSAAGFTAVGTSTTAPTVVAVAAITNTAGNISITGNDAAAGANTGISATGAIIQNQIGGNVTFISNNKISQTGTVTLVANTGGTAATVLYDTRTGNSGSTIQNGLLSIGAGPSTSAINFSELTNGALIFNGGVTVPGYILIDNTNGSSSTATLANVNGTTITGALNAGTLAGTTGVRINTVSSGTGVAIQDVAAITALAGPVTLTGIGGTANAINLTATSSISSTAGVSIIGTSSQPYATADTAGAYGAVSALGAISNTGVGGVLVQSTANTATGAITDSGVGGISITGGYGIAAGTVTGGTITAVGTLTNTGSGVISLSMAQPTSSTGGAIETAIGITTANATVSSNVSYGNVGGVMGSVDAATVNTVNYRSIGGGNASINLAVDNYTQVYGTAYNSSIANAWLADPTNTHISSISGTGGFGSSVPTPGEALASLRFAGNLGLAGNSNLVQTGTDISITGAIVSAYGTVIVTPVSGMNTYTITPKVLTVTGSNSSTVYNGTSSYNALATLGTSVSGLVTSIGGVATGDAVTGATHVISSGGSSLTGTSIAQVGSYGDAVSAATGTGLSNYSINYVPGTFTVTPATLTIAGGNRTTTYNGTSQANVTYAVSGLLGTVDAVTSVQGIASGTNASTYNDALTGALGTGLSNYNINYVNGALIIGRANLTITSAATNATYIGSAQTGSFTTSGLFIGDSVSSVAGAVTGTNVGTYTSSLSGALGTGLSNYNISYVNGGMTITKANATLVGAPNTLTYNANTQTNSGAVFTGLLGNDVNTVSATGYAVATHVAQGTIADNLSATGTNSSNYNFTITNGSLRITPATLTVVGAQATYTYDATSKTNTYTPTGLLGTDTISVSGKATAINAGTINDNLSVTFTSGAASNYTTAVTNGFLKITPAIITISGITADNKQYDGTTAAALNASGVSYTGIYSIDSAVTVNTGALTGVFSDKNVADGKTVLISGISISGPGAGNYQLSGGSTATTTANITPAPLTVTGVSLNTTYNGAAQALAAPTTSGLITGDNVVVAGTPSGTNAATYTASYSITGADAVNYTLSKNAPALNIAKAALVVTADNNGKIATQNDPALTAQLTGLQGSDTASSLGLTYSVTRAAGETVAGGPYAITPTQTTFTNSANYTISYVPGVFTITPAGTVLIKMNPTTSTYGTVVQGTVASVEYVSASGGATLYTLAPVSAGSNIYTDGVGGSITIDPTTTVTSTTNVGTYVGAISNTNNGTTTSSGNFSAVNTIVNTAVVNQANLTITINPVTKTYDAAAFTAAGATATPNGLMNGQTLAGLGGITYSGTAIGAINASGSAYTLSGSAGTGFSNYSVTVVPSTLTVNQKSLTITGGTATYTFDNTTRTNTYSVVGLQGSDSVTGVSGLGSGWHANTYNDALASPTGSGLLNYSISYVNGGIIINPAQLTAIATPTSAPVYTGGTAVANTTVLSGVIGGTVVNGATSLALSGAGVGSETIINNGTTLSGPNAGDYIVVSSNLANTATNQVTPNIVSSGNGGGTVVITPAPLTITGGNGSFVFDNTTRTNTYSVIGLLGGDSVSGVTGLASQLHAGTYADTLSAAAGVGLGNYTIAYVNGGIVIAKAPLTALATPNAMTYTGLTDVPNTTVLSGAISGTSVSGATTLTLVSPNAGTQTITNNGTTLLGDNGGDYYVVSSNLVGTGTVLSGGNGVTPTLVTTGNGGGTIPVAKAPLSIVGATTSSPYNGSTQTNTYTVSGAVNNQSITATGSGQATHVSDGTVADSLVAVAGSGANLSNYTVTITNGSIAVTPLAITGEAQVTGKTYDGTTATTGSITLSGVLAGDQGSTAATGAFTFTGANAGTQTATVSNLSINNSDYTLTVPNLNSSATIAKAPLTVTGDTTTGVTFTNTSYTNGYTSTGTLYGSDTLTGVIGSATSTHAGTSTDNLTGAIGSGISNYDITFVNGSITIDKALLTALATPSAMTYNGQTAVPNTTALSGLINGTTVAGTTSLTLGSPDAGLQNITNNGTTLSGPNAGDYLVVSSNLVGTGTVLSGGNGVTPTLVTTGNGGGTIPVAKALATVTAIGAAVPATGLTQTQQYTQTGVVTGDNLALSGLGSGVAQGTYWSNLAANNPNYIVSFVNAPFVIAEGFAAPAVAPQEINNMAVIAHHDATQTVVQSAAVPEQPVRLIKGEMLFVREMNDPKRYIQAVPVPSSGALKFAVPDRVIQDLIDLSGENSPKKNAKAPSTSYNLLRLPRGTKVFATLSDGKELPEGIKFNSETQDFDIAKLGDVNLPISVKLTLKRGKKALSEKVMIVTK